MIKKFFFYILGFILFLLFIEFSARMFLFTITKDHNVFYYGFNKYIDIYVNQMSSLNFSIDKKDVFLKKSVSV